MDSPKPSRMRRRAIGVSLLVFLLVAGGVIVGVRYQREKVAPPAVAGSAEPRVSAQLYVPMKLGGGNRPAVNYEEFRKTQAEWLRSRLVLNDALRRPEVGELSIVRAQKDPIAWLAAELRIDSPKAEILRVGLDGDATEDLRVLVDAVVAAYLQRVVHQPAAEQADRLRRLEQYAVEAKQELHRLRDAVAALRKEKALDARMKAVNSPEADPAPIRFELVQQEKLLGQVLTEILRLKVEQDAPPRVELMEAASVRTAK